MMVALLNGKKFVNSLRLRIALHIADRESDLAKQVTAVVADAAGLIDSNASNFQFIYTSSPQQKSGFCLV